MKVLVADDDPALRTLVRDLLEADLPGCELIEAADGHEAWQWLDSGSAVDICILDLRMPRLGGLELVAKLREDDRFKLQKIIVCSGVNERTPVLDALSLGVEGYLLKPFAVDTFSERIRKLLEKPAAPPLNEALVPVNEVLSRLGTNRDDYLRLLRTFTNDVSNVIADLRGDWTPDVRNHSRIRLGAINCTGKNLGALQLAARAAALEKAVAANEIAARVSRTSALEVENKRVIAAALKIAALPQSATAPGGEPAGPDAVSQKSELPQEAMDNALNLLAGSGN